MNGTKTVSPPPTPSSDGAVNRFAERRRRIEACTDAALRDDALALCVFDEKTDPVELAGKGGSDAELAASIVAFTQFLIHRTLSRAASALQGTEFAPPPESDATIVHAQRAEAAFRSVLRVAFPDTHGTGAFPIRRFERVFARFVGGELRLGLISPVKGDDPLANHGVPDGANYFCLAEAVLVFLRLGLSPDFWRPLLRSFVGGAQFFAASYWKRGKRRWGAYGSVPKPPVPAAVVLAAVDHLYSGMDPSQLARTFGDIAGVSLRQDKRLPRPVRVAKELQ